MCAFVICNFTAWDGECTGDALRPSLWRKAVPHARHLHAALMAHSLGFCHAPRSNIRLQRADFPRIRPACRAVARDEPGQHVHAPAALHLCHPLATQQVLAVPAQELGHCGHHGGRVPGARRGDLASRAVLRDGALRRGDGTQPVMGVHHGAAACVRRRRWVP